MKKIWYRLPRILSLGFVLFLSLFSTDVFSEYSGWNAVLPLLINLRYPFLLLVITLAAWKYDLLGAITYLGFAVFYILMVGPDRPLSWYISISFPAAMIGVLFVISWSSHKKSTPKMN